MAGGGGKASGVKNGRSEGGGSHSDVRFGIERQFVHCLKCEWGRGGGGASGKGTGEE